MATTDQLRKAQNHQFVNQWRREHYEAVLKDSGQTDSFLKRCNRTQLYALVCQQGLYSEVERRFTWQNNLHRVG